MSLDTKKREVVPSTKYTNIIKEKVYLDKIIIEQNFKGIDTEKMNVFAKQADIQESIDELLN